jgi:bacterioferritin-associated ferredoxin
MIVCHCLAVSSRAVQQAVASGALDLEEVAQRCGAGSRCGGCRSAISDHLVVGLQPAPA